MNGFKNFLFRGNLVDLAVAVVVGAAFSELINNFVKSFVAPLLALFGGRPDFTQLTININGTSFPYGLFLTSLISFLMMAGILYFLIILPMTKLLARLAPETPSAEQDCPHCCSTVPAAATKCKFCTADLVPTQAMHQPSEA
jgi:large conductance mechanosensitive channel